MKRAVFFDLFGTLVQTQRALWLRSRLEALGIFCDTSLLERAFYLTDRHFMREHPLLWHSRSETFWRAYLSRVKKELGLDFNAIAMAGAMPGLRLSCFPDVLPALRSLKKLGCRLAVVTNGHKQHERVLEDLGLAPWFDTVVCSALVGKMKPDAAIFKRALHELALEKQEVLHVGDNYGDDILGAQFAGIDAVLLDRHPEWTQERGPCATVSTLAGLVPFVTEKRRASIYVA